MMKRRIYTFLIATFHIISWFCVAVQPLSPLDHNAPLQLEGTSQSMQSSTEVTFHSKQFEEEEEQKAAYKLGRSRLGSRPPKCDHRCGECNPCIATQVPTNTQHLQPQFANYEPEGWKCKCGSTFFTP